MLRKMRAVLLGLSMALLIAWAATAQPMLLAQDTLATNTPRALPTNTPRPPTPTPFVPTAALELYALRLWDEGRLVNILIEQIATLSPEDRDTQLAIELTQYELERRFPGAPRNAEQRQALLNAMLSAPPGSVDMRGVVDEVVMDLLNRQRPLLLDSETLEIDGWRIDLVPVDVDRQGSTDALMYVRYPAETDTSPTYEAYKLATWDPSSGYRLFDVEYPAAPLGDFSALTLLHSGDLNRDGTFDLAVGVSRADQLNGEIQVFGWQGSSVEPLIQPGQRMLYSDVSFGDGAIETVVQREESARWGCRGEQIIRWEWTLNAFRPVSISEYVQQDSLACRLFQTEPIFSQPPSAAASELTRLLESSGNADDSAAQKGRLASAVLLALSGDAQGAQQSAADITAPQLASQRAALLDSLSDGDTAVELCAAVAAAAPTPGEALCDVDALLERLFIDSPPKRDVPLDAQFENLGLRVRESLVLQQLGRLDRQVFRFDLPAESWWAFAPLTPDTYTAERIDRPSGAQADPSSVVRRLTAPDAAVERLFAGDEAGALVALENAQRAQPELQPDPSFRYLRALISDLAGDRTAARAEYYGVWRDYPMTVWGHLAAEHLEQR